MLPVGGADSLRGWIGRHVTRHAPHATLTPMAGTRRDAELGPRDGFERLRCHRYGSLVESFTLEASFLVKPMFGCLACYLHGRLMLVLADRRPPWQGVLVPTTHESQAALRERVPALRSHPVLRKWLHLPDSEDDFEQAVAQLVDLALGDDPHLGVDAAPRRSRPRGSARGARQARRRTGRAHGAGG